MKFKKIIYCFLACLLFITNSFVLAKEFQQKPVQEMQLGSEINYTLEANTPLILSNPYLWTINATCIIQNKEDNNFLAFKVINYQCSLNNKVLFAGESRTIRLHPNETLYISALPGSEVELLNIGKQAIITKCLYNLGEL